MKYFIITKKHIRMIILAIIFLIFLFVFIFLAKYTVKKCFLPADILKQQLPVAPEEVDISKKLLGFSKDNPRSVLFSYSAAFPEKDKEKEEIEPDIQKTAIPTDDPQKIEEKTVKAKGEIKNETSYDINLEEFGAIRPEISENPAVLIVHTHTTESYAPEGDNMYFINDNSRSTDEEKNMIAVGEEMAEILKEAGIKVIHDKTFHDYPAYNGAYGRSLKTIEKNIKEHPDIEIVLDIHRDAVLSATGTATKMVCDINGQKTAQMMLVVGTDGGGLKHPEWRKNLAFAAHIQKKADADYSGLMRPLNLRDERFNQHMTKNSIIIEVGTNANTLTEAKLGASYVAKCLIDVIKNV